MTCLLVALKIGSSNSLQSYNGQCNKSYAISHCLMCAWNANHFLSRHSRLMRAQYGTVGLCLPTNYLGWIIRRWLINKKVLCRSSPIHPVSSLHDTVIRPTDARFRNDYRESVGLHLLTLASCRHSCPDAWQYRAVWKCDSAIAIDLRVAAIKQLRNGCWCWTSWSRCNATFKPAIQRNRILSRDNPSARGRHTLTAINSTIKCTVEWEWVGVNQVRHSASNQ